MHHFLVQKFHFTFSTFQEKEKKNDDEEEI